MQDYKEQIEAFIQTNFKPSDPKVSNFKKNTTQLLYFLFDTFPADCISDYDLNDIMIHLGYVRHTYSVETITTSKDKEGNEVKEKSYHLDSGWCLFTELIPSDTLKIV